MQFRVISFAVLCAIISLISARDSQKSLEQFEKAVGIITSLIPLFRGDEDSRFVFLKGDIEGNPSALDQDEIIAGGPGCVRGFGKFGRNRDEDARDSQKSLEQFEKAVGIITSLIPLFRGDEDQKPSWNTLTRQRFDEDARYSRFKDEDEYGAKRWVEDMMKLGLDDDEMPLKFPFSMTMTPECGGYGYCPQFKKDQKIVKGVPFPFKKANAEEDSLPPLMTSRRSKRGGKSNPKPRFTSGRKFPRRPRAFPLNNRVE